MREIKFRAWDKAKKCYIDVVEYAISLDGDSVLDNIDNYPGMISTHDPEEYHIEQFTGMYDKNGESIYEGDLIHQMGNNFCNYEVVFEDARFIMVGRTKTGTMCSEFDKPHGIIEVIGNIHENPELLEEMG